MYVAPFLEMIPAISVADTIVSSIYANATLRIRLTLKDDRYCYPLLLEWPEVTSEQLDFTSGRWASGQIFFARMLGEIL